MAARSIGSGTISFGLVSIPVKLYSSNEARAGISFNMLHKKCGSRLKQQYTCPQDNEIVERDQIVKGYEFSKGQYVMFTAEEIEALEAHASEAIEITEFVPASRVDPIYFDKPYYLGPEKGGEKAYRLLGEVMRRTERVALAKYAARGKQYIVMIRPNQVGLVMQQLRYADEVKPFAEVPLGDAEAEVKEAELKLAMQLVEQNASDDFRPEAYEDEVKKRTLELIQKKVDGQDVVAAPAEAPRAQVIDLMEALKESLLRKEERKSPKRAPRPAEDEGEEQSRKAAPKRAKGSR